MSEAWQPPRPPTGSRDATKTCPRCAEEIKAAATLCRFCGYRYGGGGPLATASATGLRVAEDHTKAILALAFACFGLWPVTLALAYTARRDHRASGHVGTGGTLATIALWVGWTEAAITVLIVAWITLALVAAFRAF